MRWKCLHKTALYILLAAVLLTACDRKAHNDGFCFPEGEGGLITGLITDESGIKVENAHLLVFNADDKPVAHEYFDDVRNVALHVKSLPQGRYTVLALLNMPEDILGSYTARSTLPGITLPGFIEWLKDKSPDYPDLLSGIEYADITEGNITRITITLYAGTEGITLPLLRLSLELPEPSLPDYIPTRTRSAETAYALRCVVELYKPGTDERILRKTVNPALQNGRCIVELAASQGEYDLHLWTDYTRTDAPLTDTYYNTDYLRAVGIVTNPYTANTDGKDAAYYAQSVILPQEGTTVNVQMQRPLARYRILATDTEAYRKLTETDAAKYPPLDELTVTVQYEGFFPSEFNTANGKVTDAARGIAYTTAIAEPEAEEPAIASDCIMAGDTESSVTATLTVTDKQGNVISSTSGIRIGYKQNHLTTLHGKYLTAGIGSGGITIDTDWEDIIVEF